MFTLTDMCIIFILLLILYKYIKWNNQTSIRKVE